MRGEAGTTRPAWLLLESVAVSIAALICGFLMRGWLTSLARSISAGSGDPVARLAAWYGGHSENPVIVALGLAVVAPAMYAAVRALLARRRGTGA